MISIRSMIESDLEQVMHLEKELFSNPWSEDSMRADITNNTGWVMVDGDTVLGYLCSYKVLDECQIANIAISPDQQRKGLASRFLDWLIAREHALGSRYFFLEVRESNTAARRLYEKHGFLIVGVRKKYYIRPDEDAIVMMLNTEKGD